MIHVSINKHDSRPFESHVSLVRSFFCINRVHVRTYTRIHTRNRHQSLLKDLLPWKLDHTVLVRPDSSRSQDPGRSETSRSKVYGPRLLRTVHRSPHSPCGPLYAGPSGPPGTSSHPTTSSYSYGETRDPTTSFNDGPGLDGPPLTPLLRRAEGSLHGRRGRENDGGGPTKW